MKIRRFNESNRSSKKFTNEYLKSIGVEAGGLVCDEPSCDWEDMSILIKDYEDLIEMPCPKCGSSVLTENDYNETIDTIEQIEKMSGKTDDELRKIISDGMDSMDKSEIDKVLDMINDIGKGEDVIDTIKRYKDI